MYPDSEQLLKEVIFQTSRSSGKGGQHVNKVSTQVELLFFISDSQVLNDEQKKLILEKNSSKISKKGILRIVCGDSRSQTENKKKAIAKFIRIIQNSLKVKKNRIKTIATLASVSKRLEQKKSRSLVKHTRRVLKSDLE